MQEEIRKTDSVSDITTSQTKSAINERENTEESVSMKDFEEEINQSFHKHYEGELVTGLVIGITDTEVTIDLGSYTEAIINQEELSNDPHFSIKNDIQIGDSVTAAVIKETSDGILLLSKKQADNMLSWGQLQELLGENSIQKVKIASSVSGGLVSYLKGIRAFIPASQIALEYVKDLDSFVGKELEVKVIEVDEDSRKLILSGRVVAKERSAEDKRRRISQIQSGIVLSGKVATIKPYGAFVDLGDHLSGLVHISEICGRHIKSPKEVVKEGDEVKVKVLSVKEGKISLSMKAITDNEEVLDDISEVPFEYSTGEEASTNLGALLKNLF